MALVDYFETRQDTGFWPGQPSRWVVITLLVQDQQPAQKLHGRYSRVPHLFSKIDCEPGSFWNSGRSKWSRMDLFWRSACIGRCHFLIHFDPLIREKYNPIWSSVKVMYRSCERKRVWDGIGQVKVSISTHMHTRIHHQIHYQIHHPSPLLPFLFYYLPLNLFLLSISV